MCGSDREGGKKEVWVLKTREEKRKKKKKRTKPAAKRLHRCPHVCASAWAKGALLFSTRSACISRCETKNKKRVRNHEKKKRHIKETLFQTRKRTQPSTCKLKSATASWRHAHPFTGACMCVCVCVHRHQTAMTAARQTSFMQHRGVDVRTGYFHNGIKHRKQKKKKTVL